MLTSSFPKLPTHVVNDWSTDQFYACRIYWAIINREIKDDLLYLEVGPIVYSRWLTLGCRTLRYYVSLDKPSLTLKILVHFCLTVYFPTWLDNKLDHQITHGSKHLFNLIQRINGLSDEEIRKVVLDVVQRNEYFAHPESLLIAMLRDGDEQIRSMTVTKVIALRKVLVQSFAAEGSFSSERGSSFLRLFHPPTINAKADVYYQLADIETCSQQTRPIAHLTNGSIEDRQMKPLLLYYFCHNQTVELHVKLVAEASAQVARFERRNGIIRQKIKSCSLMKKFDTKMQFT